jgi:hypothetical protein
MKENIFVGVTDEEIKFLNLIYLILEAGWCIDKQSYEDILIISGIKN